MDTKFYTALASFNTSYVSVQEYLCLSVSDKNMFQYILCVGSSFARKFQTSPNLKFQYILCVGSSIIKGEIMIKQKLFQYILCVGSR